MIPDLILHEPASGRTIILDTKFTAGRLVENQWGKPVYDSSHLYQLYAYLRSQEHLSTAYRGDTCPAFRKNRIARACDAYRKCRSCRAMGGGGEATLRDC
jgi:hypothetical protein